MGGSLVDEGGSLLIFNAEDENEVRDKLKNDPRGEVRHPEIGKHKAFANLY
jgi:hypothetical protein